MKSPNSAQILVHLPQFVFVAVQTLCGNTQRPMSMSEYVRNLIVKDLKHRELITDKIIAEELM
jgi:hypothetical protein